jgi:hypothetical protein
MVAQGCGRQVNIANRSAQSTMERKGRQGREDEDPLVGG